MQMIQYRRDLYKLLPDNCIVAELGVAEAFNSSDMCKWSNLKHIYCVDAWQKLPGFGDGNYDQPWHDKNYDAALKRLWPYVDKVTILRGITYKMTEKVEDNTLDLLYIDADHSYDGVMKDLNAWYSKVKSRGIIAGHDFLNLSFGVNKAAKDFANQIGAELFTIPEDKEEDAGFYFIKP